MSINDENEAIPPEESPAADYPPVWFSPEASLAKTAAPLNETAAPLVEKPVAPEEKLKPADRSTMSQATMIFGLAALTLSMLGGAFFIPEVFQNGLTNNLLNVLVKIVPVILAYGVGWILCLLSMRSFSNLVLPFLIKYYSWIALTGVVILYLKIMEKLFEQAYDLARFLDYNLILVTGLAALLGLHLLLNEQNLRRYSIPIMMACTLHLALMLIRFLIIDRSSPFYLFGDLYFFLIMFGIASLMLAHLGILNSLRNLVDAFFQPTEYKEMVV